MRLLPCALVLLVTAGIATAAEPSAGIVSSSAPRVEWAGTSTGYLYFNANRLARTAGQAPRCDAPACDEFTLDVKDSADLTISATYETTIFLDMDVILPDGSYQYVAGDDDNHTTVARIKKAKPGTYKIRVTTNGKTGAEPGDYTAFAQLAVPPPPASAPPSLTSPGPATPAPAASGPQLSITTRSASLRKLKKRSLAVALKSTQPVTDVKVFLRKGKKIVATGSLRSLNGAGTARLRLSKKVKPGKYVLAASAANAAASAPFRLKR